MQKKKDKNLMKTDVKPMKEGLLSRIFHLYYDGFRTMTLGKTLWAVILIKLAIIFLVLKLFFFPDFINTNAKNGDKAGFVSKEILNRYDSEFQSYIIGRNTKTLYNNNFKTIQL